MYSNIIERTKKQDTNKLKLIDILVMISKGELKKGTTFRDKEIGVKISEFLLGETALNEKWLNEEYELIEAECKHEWKKYSLGRLGGITENHRKCKKCGIDEIEAEENTTEKIKELDTDSFYDEIKGYETLDCESAVLGITDKLNEVINKVNAQTAVLLAQEKQIKEINEQLDY
ncbi:MAG: hypothetical protein IKK84_00330 [Clostridia bacterium]|nr:hypothetical protein [Clostridia bacterium]